jgi:hypothetical protein
MSVTVNVNGVAISYPQTGDSEWGDEATDFAIQTGSALGKLGLSTGTSVDIPSTLTVAGTTTLNGNTNIGNANTDTTAVTGILNVDSGTLYVDPTNNRVGINDSSPSEALDVTGNVAVSGSITGASATLTNLTVDTNLIKTDSTNNRVGINTTSPTVALDVTGAGLYSSNLTIGGVIYADDDTTANTPVISFTGDTNTGIGRSAADTIDLITNGNSRFRIESTGQIKAVYESQEGTDYNTTLHNGYLCRAWVFANSSSVIQASGNVSTITDNNTGDYTVNFTVAMPDVNYVESIGIGSPSPNVTAGTVIAEMRSDGSKSAGSLRFTVYIVGGSKVDEAISVMVFR